MTNFSICCVFLRRTSLARDGVRPPEQMSPHGSMPRSHPLTAAQPVSTDNNSQQCLAAPRASANQTMTSCAPLPSATPVPRRCFPAFSPQRETDGGRKCVCQMSMGKWTMRERNRMMHGDKPGLRDTALQFELAEKLLCDSTTPWSVKKSHRGTKTVCLEAKRHWISPKIHQRPPLKGHSPKVSVESPAHGFSKETLLPTFSNVCFRLLELHQWTSICFHYNAATGRRSGFVFTFGPICPLDSR